MPIQRFAWAPVTCPCGFVVDVDTDLPPDQITLTFVAVLVSCLEHGPLIGAALFSAALADNQLMNSVLREAERIQPALLPRNFVYEFDASRVLHVKFELAEGKDGPGVVLSDAEKTSLRSSADGLFGAGKVSVT